ncbi:hypothetical protein, partial [Bacillus toyonensis]
MEEGMNITWARTGNLFNPFIPLVHVEEYLLSLSDEDFFNVRRAIESVILEDVRVVRNKSKRLLLFR